MKRRTKDKVGSWPNMRDDTLRAICDELIRARKAHPAKTGNLRLMTMIHNSLHEEMLQHDAGKMSAAQVYSRAAQLAMIAIRVLEEGTAERKYSGNAAAPPFKLTSGFVNPDDTEEHP